MHEFPIDVDKMDYMRRDSYFSGVSHGVYNAERIFGHLFPVLKGNTVYLGILDSAYDAVLDFSESRSHLFRAVCFHKTTANFESMMDLVADYIREEKIDIFSGIENIEQLVDFYCQNVDDVFLRTTLTDKLGCGQNVRLAKAIVERILKREKFQMIYNHPFRVYGNNNLDETELKNKIKEAIEAATEKKLTEHFHFTVSIQKEDKFKGIDHSSVQVMIKNHNARERYHIKDIKNLNHTNTTFVDLEKERAVTYYVRIYIQDRDDAYQQAILDAINDVDIPGFFGP